MQLEVFLITCATPFHPRGPFLHFPLARPQHDNNDFFTLRPAIGFQRFHTPDKGVVDAASTGDAIEILTQIPGVQYSTYGERRASETRSTLYLRRTSDGR